MTIDLSKRYMPVFWASLTVLAAAFIFVLSTGFVLHLISLSRSAPVWLLAFFVFFSPLLLLAVWFVKLRKVPQGKGMKCFLLHHGLNLILLCILSLVLYWCCAAVCYTVGLPSNVGITANNFIGFLNAVLQNEVLFWDTCRAAYEVKRMLGGSVWEWVRLVIHSGFGVWSVQNTAGLYAILLTCFMGIWMPIAYVFETWRSVRLQVYGSPYAPVPNSFQSFLNSAYTFTIALLCFILVNLWLGMPTGCAMGQGVILQLCTLLTTCLPVETTLILGSFGFVSYVYNVLSGHTWETIFEKFVTILSRFFSRVSSRFTFTNAAVKALPGLALISNGTSWLTWVWVGRIVAVLGFKLACLVVYCMYHTHYLIALLIAILFLSISVIVTWRLSKDSDFHQFAILWSIPGLFIFSFIVGLILLAYQCFDPNVIAHFIHDHYCIDPGCTPIFSFEEGVFIGNEPLDSYLKGNPTDSNSKGGYCNSPQEKGGGSWWPFGRSSPSPSTVDSGIPTTAAIASATHTLDLNKHCDEVVKDYVACLQNPTSTPEQVAELRGSLYTCHSLKGISENTTRKIFGKTNAAEGTAPVTPSPSATQVFAGEAGKAVGTESVRAVADVFKKGAKK